jgi:hypothetical protein
MSILKYIEFLLEEKSELKGPMRYSPELRGKLRKIGGIIAEALLDIENTDQEFTYIDIGDAENTVGCMEVDKVFDYMRGSGHSPAYLSRFIRTYFLPYKTHRHVELRIGKLVKHLFRDTFTDPEYGEFVDKWRATKSKGKFEIWTGVEIQSAYYSENYEECSGSTLDNSCMNDAVWVDFYSFIEGCSVLVLLDEEDDQYGPVIKGRALLWKDSKGRRIMDRVYYNYAKDYQKFVEWAKENGVWYKSQNTSGESHFILGEDSKKLDIMIKCPNVFTYKGEGFPYMDTMCYAQREWLSNKEFSVGKYYKLQDTDGDFEEFYNMHDIYGEEVEDELDYVYSEYQKGYIYKGDATRLKYDGGSGFENYSLDDWFETEFVETGIPYSGERERFVEIDGKWYMEKHCVYSEKDGEWIWRPDAIYVSGDWMSHDNYTPIK